jgi:hypothetical protein
MLRRTMLFWGAGLIAGACSTKVSALTVEVVVDRKWLGEFNHASKEFAIDVKEEDGLLAYVITRISHEPKIRLTKLEVRRGGELLAECPVLELEKERQIRYQFRVSPQVTDETVFEIAEYPFVREGKEEIALPGGVIYRFPLKEYLPKGRC